MKYFSWNPLLHDKRYILIFASALPNRATPYQNWNSMTVDVYMSHELDLKVWKKWLLSKLHVSFQFDFFCSTWYCFTHLICIKHDTVMQETANYFWFAKCSLNFNNCLYNFINKCEMVMKPSVLFRLSPLLFLSTCPFFIHIPFSNFQKLFTCQS